MENSPLLTPEAIELLKLDITSCRHYEGTPFSVEISKYPEDKPGQWSTLVISIKRDDNLVGGYRRMYPSLGTTTFAPFRWKDQWYALYSANYSTTRVLKIDDFAMQDWCGESEPDGFCPGEFYLPISYLDRYATNNDGEFFGRTFYHRRSYSEFGLFTKEAILARSRLEFCGFGFMSGCHWGDDSNWKLRYIDYTQVDEKILKIDERFGYHPLPDLPLPECINLDAWEEDMPMIKAAKEEIIWGNPRALDD